jgi:hypothetical protein
MLGHLKTKAKVLWYALTGKPLIYNCTFSPPPKGGCIKLEREEGSSDVLVADCTFKGKGYGAGITIQNRPV